MELPGLLVPILLLAVGVGLLLGGAELFTEAAIDTARALRISTLAMGLLLAGAEPEELLTAAIAAGAPPVGSLGGPVWSRSSRCPHERPNQCSQAQPGCAATVMRA